MGSKGSAPRAKQHQGQGRQSQGRPGQGRPSQSQGQSPGQSQSRQPEETLDLGEGKSGLWGALAGLIVAALIAVPLSAAFGFATHPTSQQLFAGRLEEATRGGYVTFWWIVTLLLAGLPFLVGFGVAKLSVRALAIVGGIVVLFVIAILVLGQLFVF
jgi:amino acid transporter